MSRWTLDDCHSISTKFLKDYGYLEEGVYRNGTIRWLWAGEETGSVGLNVGYDNSKVRFNYTSTDRWSGEKTDKNYSVNLLKTPCQYGGFRYWFQCPFCSRRMGRLFLYDTNDFACRKCLRLAYKSQNRSGVHRITGETMSYPELEEFREKIRPYYNGKMTRNYKRYLKHEHKLAIGIGFFARESEALMKRLKW